MSEKNKKILDFMGIRPILYSPDVWGWSDGVFFSVRENNPEEVSRAMSAYAKYLTDWNWLMKAVEKCFDTKADYSLHKRIEDALIGRAENRLENVYNEVVYFIDNYLVD